KLVIHVGHKWPLALSGGWDSKNVWQKQPATSRIKSRGSVLRIFSKEQKQAFSLTSVQDFEPPLYLETVYSRSLDSSKNGTGFQVLGAQIGLPGDPRASKREISIGCPAKNNRSKWATRTIGRKVRFPWCRTRLRVFVDKDPYNKGRIRYAGYLENDTGSHFFKLDNQTLVDNKLAVLSANLKSRFDIYRFQVWKPKDGAGRSGVGSMPVNPMVRRDKAKVCSRDPNETHINLVMPGSRVYLKKINIEGNGLNIPNGAVEPNLTGHTDFGKALAAGGSVVRTFTIQNLGANALKLTGPRPCVALVGANAKSFSVTKAPRPLISRHGSTVFSIKFQPKAKGLHKAKVSILYKGKGKNRYVFHVRGRGF
ncbi:MAG: choice-of-anchor D domain-containing protein, partial [Thermodesulfobacteriota bacterium]|nr:choice-of-anchor D domain-containing protein [Thermodesulfobacteriota bacterium]